MVADKSIKGIMKYDYGDDVALKTEGRNGVILKKTGTVVGITIVENDNQVRIFGHPIGTILYTVEFGDGSDSMIPEENVEEPFQ